MKRIYIISAALLLLAIIASNVYINDKRTIPANDGVGAKNNLPVNETITSQGVDNAPAPPVTDDRPVEVAAATGSNKRRTPIKHAMHTPHYYASYQNEAPAQAGHIVIRLNGGNNIMSVERPRTFSGNMPVNVDLDAKKKCSGFTMPENIGFEIGYSHSSLQNGPSGSSPVGSIDLGLLYNVRLGNHLAFQPGVRYVTKGIRLQNQDDVDYSEKADLHYLEIPASLVWKFGKPGDARIMVGAGPYAAYLVGEKDKFSAPGYGDGEDVLTNAAPQYLKSNINTFDWGFDAFIGVQSPDGLFFKAGGEMGMMNIMKNNNAPADNRNASVQVTVGYIFGRRL